MVVIPTIAPLEQSTSPWQQKHGTTAKGIADLMDDFVWESLSSDNNSDTSLLEELERLYSINNSDEGRGGSTGDSRPSTHHDEPPRQRRLRKHRESMARLRQDRRDRIKILEKQDLALQHKLHKALKWMDLHRKNHEAKQCERLEYADLVRAAESLMGQKYALEEELIHRQRFAKLFASEISRLDDDSSVRKDEISGSPVNQGTAEDGDGFWMRFLDGEASFLYDNEPASVCPSRIEEGLQTITASKHLISGPQSSLLVAHCLGWKTERVINDQGIRPVLHFRSTRRVSRLRISIDQLQAETWTILQSPDQFTRLYGSAVTIKHVQKVSDDAFISLRNSPVPENHRQLRYFNLNTKMRTEDGDSAAIVMMVLNKQPRQSQLENDHCADQAHDIEWLSHGVARLQFSHVGDDSIEIEYVGTVECVDQGHAAHLMMECCASLLRWEHFVVPPRLLNY